MQLPQIPVMCPSGRCAEGSLLLGVVNGHGTVNLMASRFEVDAEFIRVASQGRQPEKRFRFAEPCLQGACKQWGAEGCSIIGRVEAAQDGVVTEVPDCVIRPNCRWFVQRGEAACQVCPFVVTDTRPGIEVADSGP